MQHKQAIALEIALQTHVLQTCPIHHEIFCDDDVDPSSAFALAVDLVKQHTPCVVEFEDDAHALTDLLSATIGSAPTACPLCMRATEAGRERTSEAAQAAAGAGLRVA
ncbi:MAG TPA: hypothetical protein VHY75_01610 [Steroidobacteraceae bacterium]|jgi:hypothetical protein|nr:hypothetical protein [Steroidobacteraceae bacterium]